MVTVWLQGPLEAGNCLVEPSMKTSHVKGLYIIRILAQAKWEVPIRIMNVNNQGQMLAQGTTLGHCEQVMWAVPVGSSDPETPGIQHLSEQLQKLVSDPR